MSKYLSFYGGERAIAIIKEHGLSQDIVKVVAGAAGGPKWLILGAMDRFLFSEWFTKRAYKLSDKSSSESTVGKKSDKKTPDPLFLLGSSAGAWRFAAVSHNSPSKALEKFAEAYINQWYSIKPDLAEIDIECQKVLNSFIDDNSVNEVLSHPYCRLNFFSVRSRGFAQNDNPLILASYIAAAAAANLIDRKNMRHFFTRTLFYHPSEKSPFYDMDNVRDKNHFPMLKVSLTPKNFKKALTSSGSIPLVMPGVTGIDQAPQGVYRDGGTIDYHLDIPFLGNSDNYDNKDKIVLFPHYTDRIIPGWLDKKVSWRKPTSDNFKNVLLITPNKAFTDMLPGGKIPERQDFTVLKGKNRERIQRWKIALKYSEILGDELCSFVYSGKAEEIIQPVEKIIC
ncbi:MAG: hypothetical protein HQK73_09025 [Desulfamplus sp.]|nr:hypothetical protein [Desulfamplus sp.]